MSKTGLLAEERSVEDLVDHLVWLIETLRNGIIWFRKQESKGVLWIQLALENVKGYWYEGSEVRSYFFPYLGKVCNQTLVL